MICASCAYLLRPTLAVLRQRGIPFTQPWRRDRAEWNPLTTKMARGLRAFLKPLMLSTGSETHFPYGFNAPECSPRWAIGEFAEWLEPCRVDGLLRCGAKTEIAHLAEQSPSSGMGDEDIGRWFEPGVQPFITALLDGRAEAAEAWRGMRSALRRPD